MKNHNQGHKHIKVLFPAVDKVRRQRRFLLRKRNKSRLQGGFCLHFISSPSAYSGVTFG